MGLAEVRIPQFEHHLAHHYGLGQPRYVAPERDSHGALASRFAENAQTLDTLAGLAGTGGLSIVPFISTRSVWCLAERLASLSRHEIRVAGPPPDLTERVNDKLWFAQRVRELIGHDAIPVTRIASDGHELANQLDSLATDGARVVVKVPAGSGGRGVVTCEIACTGRIRAGETARMVTAHLKSGGWNGEFPLLVGLWDACVVGSPSTQLWVPHPREGPPVLEAIFDQVLDVATFLGAVESTLPGGVRDRMSQEAMGLALLLQRLGYFGRCSFDAVLVGERVETARVHWLECNGRWGGVSTALSAMRRLIGDRPDRSCAVVQTETPLSKRRSLAEVMTLLDGEWLHQRADRTGTVLLAPRRLMGGTGINLAVVERSSAAARATAKRIFRQLTDQ
jgi:hypothetical protein